MKNRFGISKSLQGNSLLVKNHDAFTKSLQGISLFMKNHHVISKSLLSIGILIKIYDAFLKSIQGISLLMKKHQRISLKPSRVLVYSSRATPWFIEAPLPPPPWPWSTKSKNHYSSFSKFSQDAGDQEPAQFLDILHFDPCDCSNHRHWPQYIGRVVATS